MRMTIGRGWGLNDVAEFARLAADWRNGRMV